MYNFSKKAGTAHISPINTHINKDATVAINRKTLDVMSEVASKAPENTCWTGLASPTENGWLIQDLSLFAQKPKDGIHLSEAQAENLRVWAIKTKTMNMGVIRRIPGDGVTIVLVLDDEKIECMIAVPGLNELLRNVNWVIDGPDPFAEMQAEIQAEMDAKVRKIGYTSTTLKPSTTTGAVTTGTAAAHPNSLVKGSNPDLWPNYLDELGY